MPKGSPSQDPVEAVAVLGDPNRRRLYDIVVDSAEPLGRDDAAAALGISRELAAFHLDRLVAGGMLATEYRRLNGRSGPGAGRPAKLYRRADREVTVSLPPRHYEIAADLFADVLGRLDGTSAADAVADAAHARGIDVGVGARGEAGSRPCHHQLMAALLGLLRDAGYEPEIDRSSGDVSLRNCPYKALAASHRDLTCGMNLAWAKGVVEGLIDPRLDVELVPTPGRCCVVFRER